MNSIEVGEQNGFVMRPDGNFFAHAGNVSSQLLKAQTNESGSISFPFEGRASTSSKDRQGESLLQKGLDFSPFIDSGEFNFNHIPHTFVGVPIGDKAWYEPEGWMCKGEILGDMPVIQTEAGVFTTTQMVARHNALKKAGHAKGLCLSVEGKVTKRSDCGSFVKKAKIFNIALTFRPINPNCSLNMLAKAFSGDCRLIESESFYKSLKDDQIKSCRDSDEIEDQEEITRRLVQDYIAKGYTPSNARKIVYGYLSHQF
jgi:hypothetical protein